MAAQDAGREGAARVVDKEGAFDVKVEEYAKDNGLPMGVARRRVEYDLANDEVEF